MKINRKTIGVFVATLTLTVATATAMFIQGGNQLFKSNAEEHSATSDCYWNHYAAKAPTNSSIGCKEYWVCCDHHYVQLEEPTVGRNLDADPLTVSDETITYINNNPQDIRYVEKNFVEVVPTTAQLMKSDSYTWSIGGSKHISFDSQTTVERVALIEDDTIRNTISNASGSKDYVLHIKSNDGSGNIKFNGLNSTNVPNGKDLSIEMRYYYVVDTPHFLYNGSGSGNKENVSGGNLKKWTFSIEPTVGFDYISVYPAGTLVDIYVYMIRVSMKDHVYEDTTPAGHALNEVINVYQSGAGFAGNNKNGYSITDYDDGIANLSDYAELGTSPKKVNINNPNGYVEINHGNQTKIEAGVQYRITMDIYNVDFNGNIYLMFDSNTANTDCFNNLTAGELDAGHHQLTATVNCVHSVDWLCLHSNTGSATGSFYIGNITVTVLAI